MNLSNHPDGYAIGPSLTTAELVDTSAEIVIAIEKVVFLQDLLKNKLIKNSNQ